MSLDKKRICFVTENAMGGIPVAIKGIITSLNSDIFDFSVVLLDYSWRHVGDASVLFRDLCSTSVYHFNHINNRYSILKKMHSECYANADLIVAAMQYDVLANFTSNKPKPIVLMVHGDGPIEEKLVRDFENAIDHFVPISEKIYQNINNWLSNPTNNTYLPHVLPELDLPYANHHSDDFTVLFVGRFNHFKGVDQLLEIGSILSSKKEEINFIIITDGVDEDKFKESWAYNSSTKFYNNISNSEVQQLMANGNVILMPSTGGEGFPVVLVEALRRKVVPLVSDLDSGMKEIVSHGENGYLYHYSATNNFAEKLIELKKDRSLLNELAENALISVNKKFNSKKNAEAYQKLFLQTISNGKNTTSKINVNDYLGFLDRKYIPNLFTIWFRNFYKLIKN